MAKSEERSSRPSIIDAELLERMGRIARGLPGHTVSVAGGFADELADGGLAATGETELDAHELRDREPPRESGPVLKIDGVVADEVLERCYRGLEAG
jgi:hypothetical protein